MQHTLRENLLKCLFFSYFIYFLIQGGLKSDQLRHEFQEMTSHHGVAVMGG